MSPASIARFSFVAAVTGILCAGALIGAGGGCSVNTAGIGDPGSGIGGNGSDSRGGVGGNTSVVIGTGGAVSTGSGGSESGTGGSDNGNAGANGAGGAISGTGGGAGGAIVTGEGGAHDGAGGTEVGTGGTTNGTGGAGMGGAGVGGAPGTGGRGTGGTPGMGGTGMGGTGAGGAGTGGAGTGGASMGGAPGTGGISVIGCADGSREAFVNVTNFPSIAGCAGGWSVPGMFSTASMTPQCNRTAGNDGAKPNGNGCSVADLCAVGWHVCTGATELSSLNVTCAQAGLPNGNNQASQVLYATRQRGVIGTTCNANDTAAIDTNDVHGCGNFGIGEDPNCAPLNQQFSHTECDDLSPPWSCPGALTEGATVVKSSSANGGVLCCKS